jgi:two-component system, LytTR family, sensor kinase
LNCWLRARTSALTVKNNKGLAPSSETSGGIGLKNIEERMKLIYPGRYSLKVEENEKSFVINLKLVVV